MTKTELMENYAAEQLAEMVVKLNNAMDSLKYSDSFLKSGLFDNPAVAACEEKINILQNKINNLEEENGRLQSKLDTYDNRLLQRCTKEAKEMIDQNHFSGVRIVTQEQWNNRRKADGRVCFPKEYEQTVKEFLNIDTSEIQDDCHRFGIDSLQRYLKNPAPIKISKRDDKNMNISEIQKCQDEYEKLLKESPLEGVMDKITKDILEQKNNAMAMEFTRIICDLLKRYGVYVHCTETKLSENITHNSIEEQYGIVFDSMDFSQHDKGFADRIEELEKQLDRSQTTINQIDEILEKLFDVRHDTVDKPDEFEKILYERIKGNVTDFLPTEPIKVADILINAKGEYEHNPIVKKICGKDKGTYRIFEISELRQIVEHLLVYCNHNKEEKE